jgi:hypothetical protein
MTILIASNDGSNWMNEDWLIARMTYANLERFIKRFLIVYKRYHFLFQDAEEQYGEMIFDVFTGKTALTFAPSDRTLGKLLSRRLLTIQKKQNKSKGEEYDDKHDYR